MHGIRIKSREYYNIEVFRPSNTAKARNYLALILTRNEGTWLSTASLCHLLSTKEAI